MEKAILSVMAFGCLLVLLSFAEGLVTGHVISSIVEAGTTMSLGGGLGSIGLRFSDRTPTYAPPPEQIDRRRRASIDPARESERELDS